MVTTLIEHNLMYACSPKTNISYVNCMSVKNRPCTINFINNIAKGHFHVYFTGCLRLESAVYSEE